MKTAPRWLLLGLFTSVGCGSASAGLISDGINIINEVSDSLRKVVDEDSATKFVEGNGKSLREKWDDYQKRVDKWTKDRDDADLQQASAFMNTDKWLAVKNKRKGAIEHIFGQRGGDLDKQFMVWASKNGVAVDRNMPPDEIVKKAASALQTWHDSYEAWFKESFAATKNLKDAQDRLSATARKINGTKLKEVASSWSSFLTSQ